MTVTTKKLFNRENENEILATYDTDSVDEVISKIGPRDCSNFVKGYGRVFDTEKQMKAFAQSFDRNGYPIRWMTEKQRYYMCELEIPFPSSATIDYASYLIDIRLAEISAATKDN